ncbi:MAG: ImmA/IrrE family metallo-endopeptidase, partial [Caldilineae bacterium]
MQIQAHPPFLSEAELETRANALLHRYRRTIAPLCQPPVPVEAIADFLLELDTDWLPIPDTDDEPILAYLRPATRTICFNERRQDYFARYPGTYEFTLAHEIGHYTLHLTGATEPSAGEAMVLCRNRGFSGDRREWQAERFASFLLMPLDLLQPALAGVNLLRWPDLYRLRDRFRVSITALTVRLERLGLLYVSPDGDLYPNREAALPPRRETCLRLAKLGHFHRRLGHTEQAIACYREAMLLARDLGHRREEAYCAWELGQLYAPTHPARAGVPD